MHCSVVEVYGVDNMFDWLFGTKRETNYDDTNKLYGQFDSARNEAQKFYDDNIAGKDWGSLDTQTKANLSTKYNQLDSNARGLSDQYTQTNDLFNQEEKATRNDYFGNGLLGALLNPFAQTFDAGMDAITGNYEGRDLASDLGAVGESALTFVPFAGGAMKAAKLGKAGNAVSKAVNSIPGMAGVGAGFGGLEALRQGGSETDIGDVMSQAGLGAAFGGAIPLAGKMLRNRGSKVLSRNMASRGMEQPQINAAMGSIPSKALYSTAVRSFIPKSTFGKVALGGGALLGGNALMNRMGGEPQVDPSMMMQNDVSGGQMTEEQLYNYLMSMGAI